MAVNIVGGLRVYVHLAGRGSGPPAGWGSALSPLRRPSWCRHSSLPRRRRMKCSVGWSLCGNPHGASVGRSWAPWHRGQSCSPSRPTCRAGGSTRHSPWRVLSVFTAALTQAFTEWVFFFPSGVLEPCFQQIRYLKFSHPTGHHELKGQWNTDPGAFCLFSKSFQTWLGNIYISTAQTSLLLFACNTALQVVFSLAW